MTTLHLRLLVEPNSEGNLPKPGDFVKLVDKSDTISGKVTLTKHEADAIGIATRIVDVDNEKYCVFELTNTKSLTTSAKFAEIKNQILGTMSTKLRITNIPG
jgi:hypothetical protein